MTPTDLKSNLAAVRAELDRLTVTGVRAARSIAGMANVLDKCIADIKDEQDEQEETAHE